jgi:hypothetical protein
MAKYLIDGFAQDSLDTYLTSGGKLILCGDRLAYNMADPQSGGLGCDSLEGEFLLGIMGTEYIEEMPSPFSAPYVYMEGVDSVYVHGGMVSVNLDSLALYRGCPGRLKDMSFIDATVSPCSAYTAQPLLWVLDPEPLHGPADGAVYVEELHQGGQCVYINFDLSAVVNHTEQYCTGATPAPASSFSPGVYEGRVDLFRCILEDIFRLVPSNPGGGGTARTEPKEIFRWALMQNTPNPSRRATEIRYEVAGPGWISIKVYNAQGQRVSTLVDERKDAGRFAVHWDGTNDAGRRVASGIYFYRMESGDFTMTHKMLLMR